MSPHCGRLGDRSLVALLIVAAAGCGPGASAPAPGPAGQAPDAAETPGGVFREVTGAARIDFVHRLADGHMDNIVEAVGSGGAWLDYDGDGRLDLVLVQSGWSDLVCKGEKPDRLATNRLYRNRGDGTFEDATAQSGLGRPGFGVAAAAADYDGDGRVDLYVVNDGPNVLWRNRGDGSFEDVTDRAQVGDAGCGAAATWFDADGDGRPDLYVANYLTLDPNYRLYHSPDGFPGPLAYEAQPHVLYRNRGDGTFEDVSEASGVRAGPGRGMGVCAFDYDGDGRGDLFVANDATAHFLFHNEGGRFAEVGVRAGAAFGLMGEGTAAMAGIPGDYDRDGLLDLFVSDATYCSLYRNLGKGLFQDRALAAGVSGPAAVSPSWGAAWLDFDDDGDLDLVVAKGDLHHMNGYTDLLLENRGDGTFSDASLRGGGHFLREMNGRACLPADFDDDGDIDVLLTNLHDRPVLLRNESAHANAWITLTLRGISPNTQAFGAKVVVEAGGRRQFAEMRCPTGYLGQGDPRLHFGLGTAQKADRIEIRWPSGATSQLRDVRARQFLSVSEESQR